MRRFLLLLALLPAATLGAQPSRPLVGAMAPEPGFDRRLDGRAAPTLADLRGRAVVLEFWATWCVPCLQAFPHLNLLAGQYDPSRVAFLAVSDEDSATVAALLDRRPLEFVHLLDADGSAMRAYGVTALPKTALLYPDGRLAGTLPAALVDRGLVDALIAGRPISMPDRPAPDTTGGFDPKAQMETFLARLETRPDTVTATILRNPSGGVESRTWMPIQWGYLEAHNAELGRLLALLLDSTAHQPIQRRVVPVRAAPAPAPPPSLPPTMRQNLVQMPDSMQQVRLDALVSVRPEHGRTFAEVFEPALEAALDVEIEDKLVPDTAYVLRRDPARPLALTPSGASRPGGSFRRGLFRGAGEPVALLVMYLNLMTQRPVRDETGMKERYDWLVELTPPVEGPNGARRLAEALGFVLVPELLPQRRLVVTPRPR